MTMGLKFWSADVVSVQRHSDPLVDEYIQREWDEPEAADEARRLVRQILFAPLASTDEQWQRLAAVSTAVLAGRVHERRAA